METIILTSKTIEQAANLIKSGQLVAFPTETVYGLGADATNDRAVQGIYQAKGRPSDNPLISHVSSIAQVKDYAEEVPDKAIKLMEAFWPGPLTVILKKKPEGLSNTVTAGLTSASFRMPNNPLALELIEKVGKPIAGPSANTSGRPSPTTGEHVYHDLKGKIAGILDDGPTEIGVESTVLDLTDPNSPAILRPGAVTQEAIENVIGSIRPHEAGMDQKDAPKSPGMKYMHYTPNEPVYIVSADGLGWQKAIEEFTMKKEKIGILASQSVLNQFVDQVEASYSLGEHDSVEEAAKHLYAGLRYFEGTESTVILAEEFVDNQLGLAYMNRLEKAAGFKKI